jgi:hypothetical protein
MSNILTAIKAIYESTDLKIAKIIDGNNMMNDMGEGLEDYIKHAFANVLSETDKKIKIDKCSQTFSYLGNKTNPPDMILKNSDAIEVKKVQSLSPELQLNSSHPKNKLYSNNSKINKKCRECEDKLNSGKWMSKDIIYIIGHVPDKTKVLKTLWLVFGDCYAAEPDVYTKVENKISNSIISMSDIELEESTKELGRVKKVDPLNISSLRVRGMWLIQHPKKVFDYIYKYDTQADFQLIALMNTKKYDSFPDQDREFIENTDLIEVNSVKIQDPNNPAILMSAKLITIVKKGAF